MYKAIFIICGIIIVSIAGTGVYLVSDRYAGLLEKRLIRNATLFDLKGTSWNITKLGDKLGIVYLGYTTCPDVCPTTLNNMGSALKSMGARRNSFQPIFVSVDPERDRPEIVKAYTDHFDQNILNLTGTDSQLKFFSWIIGAHFSLRKKEEQDYDYVVDHSANIFAMDADGQVAMLPIQSDPTKLKKLLLRTRNNFLINQE